MTDDFHSKFATTVLITWSVIPELAWNAPAPVCPAASTFPTL